jgi:hypothetical protein
MDNIVTDQRNGSRRLKLRGILSISGDGAVALILDVAQLVRTACRHEETIYH